MVKELCDWESEAEEVCLEKGLYEGELIGERNILKNMYNTGGSIPVTAEMVDKSEEEVAKFLN